MNFNSKEEIRETISLYDLITAFSNKTFIKAPYQREDNRWNDSNGLIQQWKKDIINKTLRLDFPIYTCSIKNDRNIYLHDGLQRLSNTIKILNDQSKNKQDYIEYLKIISIDHFHLLFEDYEEAFEHFVKHNLGVKISTPELLKGFRCVKYSCQYKEYNRFYERMTYIINNILENKFKLYPPNNVVKLQQYERDNFGLYWRYLSCDKSLSDYKIKDLQSSLCKLYGKKSFFDEKLVNTLLSMQKSNIGESLNRFELLMNNKADLFYDIYRLNIEPHWNLKYVFLRWWLACSIYNFNNGDNNEWLINFTKGSLQLCAGGTDIPYINKNGKTSHRNFQANQVNLLPIMCNAIGIKLPNVN